MTNAPSLRVYRDAVAIVTGGASGIGRALAEALVRQGADVLIADRQAELAEEVAGGIRQQGGRAGAAELDVRDFQAVDKLVQARLASRGRLDFIFNNAGIGVGGEVRDYQIQDWNDVLDVNLHGVVNGIQAAYPIMVRQGFGHIVNTASMAGLMPAPGSVSYAASKYAVVGLSSSLRIEAAAVGVRVSVLCPGVIRTPILLGGKYGRMLRPTPPETLRALWESLRPMPPERLAAKVLRAVRKNRPIIVVPSWWKVFWWINRLSPSLGLYVGRRLHQRSMRLVGAALQHAGSDAEPAQ